MSLQDSLNQLLAVEGSSKNPYSSANGPYQFLDSTWAEWGNGSDRTDPNNFAAVNSAAGGLWQSIQSQLGSNPNYTGADWQTYLGWQQGATGASRVLSADPNAPITSVLSADAVSKNGGNPNGTVGDFTDYIQNFWNSGASSGAGQNAAATNPASSPGTAANVPAGATAQAAGSSDTSASSGGFWSKLEHLAVRFMVFIIGGIFILQGLRMFGNRVAMQITGPTHRVKLIGDAAKKVAPELPAGPSMPSRPRGGRGGGPGRATFKPGGGPVRPENVTWTGKAAPPNHILPEGFIWSKSKSGTYSMRRRRKDAGVPRGKKK